MLQEDLRLRADQESAWAGYADRVRAIASDVMRNRSRLQEKTDVPRQLEHIVDTARNRLTALEDVSAAAKNLYGTLTPQQEAVADPRLATLVGLLAGAAPVSIDGRAAGSYRDRSDRPNKQ